MVGHRLDDWSVVRPYLDGTESTCPALQVEADVRAASRELQNLTGYFPILETV